MKFDEFFSNLYLGQIQALYSLCSINPLGFVDESSFILIKFHSEGEPEASICCVAKDSK